MTLESSTDNANSQTKYLCHHIKISYTISIIIYVTVFMLMICQHKHDSRAGKLTYLMDTVISD